MNTLQEKIDKILSLKKQRNAVILAHYYQEPNIQDIADFLGDSLALAQAAKNTTADVILFCGVHFMAETAKILNPDKIVIIPDLEAGCSLADAAPADKFLEWKNTYPDNVFISYINCSAAVKSMSDIICTSSNAEKIVNSVPPDKKICFSPDKYLGRYIIKRTGREMILWDGSCQVHEIFSEKEILNLTNKYPDAVVLAHPECPDNILDFADYVGSTTGIISYAGKDNAEEFIIATEPGVIHQMEKHYPSKKFYPVPSLNGCSCNECPHMRLNTLDKMIYALENLSPQINLSEDLIVSALKPLKRMLELS